MLSTVLFHTFQEEGRRKWKEEKEKKWLSASLERQRKEEKSGLSHGTSKFFIGEAWIRTIMNKKMKPMDPKWHDCRVIQKCTSCFRCNFQVCPALHRHEAREEKGREKRESRGRIMLCQRNFFHSHLTSAHKEKEGEGKSLFLRFPATHILLICMLRRGKRERSPMAKEGCGATPREREECLMVIALENSLPLWRCAVEVRWEFPLSKSWNSLFDSRFWPKGSTS